MTDTSSSTIILAIPGTQETQEMPREAVLEAIQKGEIGPDHWIWSPSHNEWKHPAEVPELHHALPVEPAFVLQAVPVPTVTYAPRIAHQAQEETDDIRARAVAPRQSSSTFSETVEENGGFPFFKVIFAIPFLAVLGVIAANYFMVNQPFDSNLARTSFAGVQAYAHLGAFAQPDALVIHVVPTKEVTSANFADFLIALAKSTPSQPFDQKEFKMIGLTSSWQSQYVFHGADWQTLAQMGNASAQEKEKFELQHLERLDGSPLLRDLQIDNPATVAAHEAKAWQTLVSNFLPRSS